MPRQNQKPRHSSFCLCLLNREGLTQPWQYVEEGHTPINNSEGLEAHVLRPLMANPRASWYPAVKPCLTHHDSAPGSLKHPTMQPGLLQLAWLEFFIQANQPSLVLCCRVQTLGQKVTWYSAVQLGFMWGRCDPFCIEISIWYIHLNSCFSLLLCPYSAPKSAVTTSMSSYP